MVRHLETIAESVCVEVCNCCSVLDYLSSCLSLCVPLITFEPLRTGIVFVDEPGSSVSIVSCCGLDDLVIEVRSPTEAKGFFL
jgi:hypothetical protein